MPVSAKLKSLCRPHWNQCAAREPVSRLWRRDHTLWKPDPGGITNRLGWLDLPFSMRPAVVELNHFARDVCATGFADVVLLGMGGSSLCAEVMRLTFGKREGFPELHVLDSTAPATVERLAGQIDPARTLFLVSSKSGGTVEVMSFYRYFRQLVEQKKGAEAGGNFVAITDRGTSLEKLAADQKFRRTFINPSDVGGRYSALSYFGLTPAVLMGLDADELLSRAREMSRSCGVRSPAEDNGGGWLGMVAGCLALNGRDKLTIVTSPALAGFGLWAEQLVAESTGKEGRGIVPIAQEPFAPPEAYGKDRFFVYLRLAGDRDEATESHLAALDAAGFPVVEFDLRDRYDLGGEFFRWEFGVAVAGACLEINPFDQPNVEESKQNTRRVLDDYQKTRSLPKLQDEGSLGELLKAARPGDYLAVTAFADETPELNEAFDALRRHVLQKRRVATTLGYGPRFLHSTGQLHKGGPDSGLFLQVTCEPEKDVPIPGESYGFGTLASAQAIGDFDALRTHKRRIARVHVPKGQSVAGRVRSLLAAV